jgi:hypothetical protein
MDTNIQPRRPKPRVRPHYCPFTRAVLRWSCVGLRGSKVYLGYGPTADAAFDMWRTAP